MPRLGGAAWGGLSRLRSSKIRAASSSTIWVLMSASGSTSLG